MSISPTSTATAETTANTAARTTSPAKTATLNYDNFLKLLVAQMKNQNPTDPMKSTEYMGQLATFSQVEQSVNMNSKLDALLASSTMSQAGSLIGHTMTSEDGATTGTVAAVQVTKDGLHAYLDSGKDIPYGPGVIVS